MRFFIHPNGINCSIHNRVFIVVVIFFFIVSMSNFSWLMYGNSTWFRILSRNYDCFHLQWAHRFDRFAITLIDQWALSWNAIKAKRNTLVFQFEKKESFQRIFCTGIESKPEIPVANSNRKCSTVCQRNRRCDCEGREHCDAADR